MKATSINGVPKDLRVKVRFDLASNPIDPEDGIESTPLRGRLFKEAMDFNNERLASRGPVHLEDFSSVRIEGRAHLNHTVFEGTARRNMWFELINNSLA